MRAVIRSVVLAAVLVAAGAGCKRAQPAAATPSGGIDIIVDGKPAAPWTRAELAAAATITVTNQNGETRAVWPLQKMVHARIGPKARIVALDADGDRVDVAAQAWNDPARTLVLHLSRRGEYKAHWVSGGVAEGALVKGVRKIEIRSAD